MMLTMIVFIFVQNIARKALKLVADGTPFQISGASNGAILAASARLVKINSVKHGGFSRSHR